MSHQQAAGYIRQMRRYLHAIQMLTLALRSVLFVSPRPLPDFLGIAGTVHKRRSLRKCRDQPRPFLTSISSFEGTDSPLSNKTTDAMKLCIKEPQRVFWKETFFSESPSLGKNEILVLGSPELFWV